MTDQQHSLQDIKAIRQMMEASSRFLSLSGLSGIAAGTFAILGAAITYFFILDAGNNLYNEHIIAIKGSSTEDIRLGLLIVAVLVFIGAVSSAWYISWYKAKKNGQKFWTHQSKKMTVSLIFFLTVGGLFSGILVLHDNIQLVASAMLIFYGLALINAAQYTFRDIKYLGICEVILGVVAGIFLNYGLLLWTIGFGVLHIVYGISMYYKYER
jgi:hypothetical protein